MDTGIEQLVIEFALSAMLMESDLNDGKAEDVNYSAAMALQGMDINEIAKRILGSKYEHANPTGAFGILGG